MADKKTQFGDLSQCASGLPVLRSVSPARTTSQWPPSIKRSHKGYKCKPRVQSLPNDQTDDKTACE